MALREFVVNRRYYRQASNMKLDHRSIDSKKGNQTVDSHCGTPPHKREVSHCGTSHKRDVSHLNLLRYQIKRFIMRTNWDNNNWTNSNTTSDSNFQSLDVTKLPGYQVISSDCPTWKRPLIEKRNKQIEEDAMRELLAVKQEEQKWKDIPDWKKTILLEKEKKRQQEMAPYIAENRRMEEEMTRLQSLPEWKRNLLLKKRGDPM